MGNVALRTISVLVMTLSIAWLYAEPHFEPLIATLLGATGLVSSFFIDTSSPTPNSALSRVVKLVAESPQETFESEFWPEEGKPKFEAASTQLVLRERPESDAPVCKEINLPLSVELPYSAFRYRTLRPGIVVAKAPGRLRARSLGRTPYVSRENYYDTYSEYRNYEYDIGDAFEYLQYRAEGSGFIRWHGDVLDTDLPWIWGNDQSLELQSKPEAECWIHLLGNDGCPLGWLRVDDFAKEVGREF